MIFACSISYIGRYFDLQHQVNLSISPFSSLSILTTFASVKQNCHIFLAYCPLYYFESSFPFLVMIFTLNLILPVVSKALSQFFFNIFIGV